MDMDDRSRRKVRDVDGGEAAESMPNDSRELSEPSRFESGVPWI